MTVLRGAERVGGEARVLVPDTVLPRSRWIRRRAAPHPSLRGRFARLDPLVALTCVVAAAVFVLHGFDGVLSRDLGVYMYAGQQVADGVAPYAGILNRAGPLAHLLPGIGVATGRWVGADDVLSARVLFMMLSVACVGTAYVLGRDLFRSRPAGLATAATLLCFEGFIRYATYGPREKTAMVLFLLCALLAVTHRRWLTAGCFIALATLTWQPALLAALAAAVTAALLAPAGTRLRALARIAIGGLVPTAVTVGVFMALGELRAFLDDFVLINLQYTHQAPLLDRFGKTWGVLRDAYGWSLWVFFVGAVALLVLSVVGVLRRSSRHDERTAALAGTGVALVAGLVWSWTAFNSWPDAFVLLPAAAVGIGGLAALVGRLPRAWVALALVLAWVGVATAASFAYSVGERDQTLLQQRRDVAAVMALLPPGSRILSVDAPQPLVLTGQTNASRFQVFSGGLTAYLQDTWPGGTHGYGEWVAAQAPTVIALGNAGAPGWLDPVLAESYHRLGRSNGWTWAVSDSVPLADREAIRAALVEN